MPFKAIAIDRHAIYGTVLAQFIMHDWGNNFLSVKFTIEFESNFEYPVSSQ